MNFVRYIQEGVSMDLANKIDSPREYFGVLNF